MKSFTLSILLFFYFSTGFCQQNLSLSRVQMYADFDTLSSTLKRVSPHIALKKAVWKYDAMKEIASLRAKIDTISTDLGYFVLLQEAIASVQDLHTSLWGEQSGWAKVQEDKYWKLRNGFKLSVPNVYSDGRYLITDPFVVDGDTVNIGTEVTHIEDQKISDYLRSRLWAREGCSYDLKRKTFYTGGFFKNMESIFQPELKFTFRRQDGKSVTHSMATDQFTKYLPMKGFKDSSRVEYWQTERVLYIRLMKMDEALKPALFAALTGYIGRTDQFSKIIIDIRGNGGGNDNVWQDLYSRLIDRPISYSLQIDASADPLGKAVIAAQTDSMGWKQDSSTLLKDFGLYQVVNKKESIEVDSSSLHFTGKIIVLAERHYSSAGSMVAVAASSSTDNIIAMGRSTGYFMGIGFAPGLFKLPYSGLQYRIAPSIEVSRVNKLSDLMHDEMEVEVPYDMGYYREKFRSGLSPYTREFMVSFDPMIRAAIRY